MSAVRTVLANGLRLVVVPEPDLPVAAVSLHVGVGYRDEPPGRGGFAHLFEHLMFTPRAADGVDHIQAVQRLGGSANAVTRPDHTCFHETVPPGALGAVLALGAQRMHPPPVDGPGLRREVAVIEREIALTVDGRPLGGFPWQTLPSALYRGHADTHDGYGSLAELAAATPEDCAAFAARWYVPANAVLTVLGPVVPDRVAAVVDRYWGALPSTPAPPRTPLDTVQAAGRVHVARRAGASRSAVAVGHRLPDPATDRGGHLARVALAALLDGPQGRLAGALTAAGSDGSTARAHCGLFGSPLQARHPDTLVLSAVHDPGRPGADVAAVLEGAVERVAAAAPGRGELATAVARLATATAQHLDRPEVRCASTGLGELLHGDPTVLPGLPRALASVPVAAVTAAAEAFTLAAARGENGRAELVGTTGWAA